MPWCVFAYRCFYNTGTDAQYAYRVLKEDIVGYSETQIEFSNTVKVVISARSYFRDLPILNCFTCF